MTDTDPAEQERADRRARMEAHINAAVACLDELGDPVEREFAARELADELLPDAGRRVKAVRSDGVRELRYGRGLKLREVAELIDLSIPRVDQLAKGK
ncbi:hypothetical protein [Streptomyces catenulae]|uniref:RNA polymerase sigma-70 region 4 domain-containing protein n=1 Tax=Streptomyces catenulae TaxID=66875 RepID=A0ABV2YXM5_9ACTN|nr:hypothetical protein [Streptomyces catenulae]